MSEHSAGLLEYSSAGHGWKDQALIIDEYFVRRPGDDVAVAADIIDPETGKPSEANARRLVACWNALEHVSTEQLETGKLLNLSQQAVELRRQRDELLAALEMIKHATAPTHDDGAFHENAYSLADAAIAKAGPQTKGAEDAARRVSACLAACAGISTPVLEKGRLSSDAFQLEESRADKAEQQCEELLAALEALIDADDRPHVGNSEVVIRAEAAIAKAKGTPVIAHDGAADSAAVGVAISSSEPHTLEDLKAISATRKMSPEVARRILDARDKAAAPATERYTHITKGGVYERVGSIYGAGSLKGINGVAYCNDAGKMFIREPESFAARMQLIVADGGFGMKTDAANGLIDWFDQRIASSENLAKIHAVNYAESDKPIDKAAYHRHAEFRKLYSEIRGVVYDTLHVVERAIPEGGEQ